MDITKTIKPLISQTFPLKPNSTVMQMPTLVKHIKPAPINDFVFAFSQSAPSVTPQTIDNLNNPPPGVGKKWSWK